MSLLRKRLSPSDTIRWISASSAGGSGWLAQNGTRLLCRVLAGFLVALVVLVIALWDSGSTLNLVLIIAFLLGFAALFATDDLADTEVAVLAGHVVWNDRWLFKKELPRVRLDDIDLIDVEQAGDTVTLRCGSDSHRLEEVVGGQVEQFARTTGRPVRIWRKCNSPSAIRARQLRKSTYLIAMVSMVAPMVFFLLKVLDMEIVKSLPEFVKFVVIIVATMAASFAAGIVEVTAPHLLAGRGLMGDERRDFFCTMADPRWDGVQPDDPGDPLPPGPFQRWAMRMAYGEVPVYERWEPEIVDP